MALITCKDCKKEFSTDAKRCPHCGAKKPNRHLFLKTIIILGFIVWMSSLIKNPSPTGLNSQVPNASTGSFTEATNGWSYFSSQDAMTSKKTFFASIDSVNTLSFDFPYAGAQHATFQLRTHPSYGKDAILSIEKGQLLCSSYDGCTVMVRFDEGKAMRFSAVGPSDHSTTSLFIRGYSKLISQMAKAKKMRIAAEFYQSGTQTMEFNVAGFDSSKYLENKK